MPEAHQAGTRASLDPELRAGYLRLIERRFGLRLSDEYARRLDEAVQRLLTATAYTDPSALYSALVAGRHARQLETAAETLTIGETEFFRVGPQMDALRRTILPDLVARRGAERSLRIWSAGCSTGEEPYTLAILLRERLADLEAWDLDLLATDLNREALEAAHRAEYETSPLWSGPDFRYDRYFVRDAGRWQLRDEIRRMVRFVPYNLVGDEPVPSRPPGWPFDLIVCRNVTIYFSPEAATRLYRRVAAGLAPGGWLLLGPSDPVPAAADGFEAVSLHGTVAWRRTAPFRRSAQVRGSASRPDRSPARSREALRDLGEPMLERAPRTQRAWQAIQQVRLLREQGQLEPARDLAEQVARQEPRELEIHLLLGELHLEADDLVLALASLRRATYLDERHVLAQVMLGRAYARSGERARARATFGHARRLLDASPDERVVPGSGRQRAGELRRQIDAELVRI